MFRILKSLQKLVCREDRLMPDMRSPSLNRCLLTLSTRNNILVIFQNVTHCNQYWPHMDTRMPLKKRATRFRPFNIIHRLRVREVSGSSPLRDRCLYQNITPNFSFLDIRKHPCFIRKFSPDGRYLIGFSSDQISLEIYQYLGASAASSLLNKCPTIGQNNSQSASEEIRNNIFESLFKLKHVVNVAIEGEHLNRECSLFLSDPNLVIVGSAGFLTEEQQPHYNDAYRSNESVSLSGRFLLENYTLHLIDMRKGIVCHTKCFKTDKIILSHHQGLCLYKRNLAVLSIQHQAIHIMCVVKDPESGVPKFNDVETSIGRFCHSDDAVLVEIANHQENQHRKHKPSIKPFQEKVFGCLKQRLLTHLFQVARLRCWQQNTPEPMNEFHKNFDHYRNLKMYKMQLLDDEHILIKYTTEEMITRANIDVTTFYLYSVYNFKSTQMVACFRRDIDSALGSLPELFGLLSTLNNFEWVELFAIKQHLLPNEFSEIEAGSLLLKDISGGRYEQTIRFATFASRIPVIQYLAIL